jgi:P4 family phage/plasmid primase-like protien
MYLELRQRPLGGGEQQVDGGTFFTSLDEFFTKIPKIVAGLEDKRNLIVTLGNMNKTLVEQGETYHAKLWENQELLFFDVDMISAVHKERYEDYINIIAEILFIKPSAITLIDSGNGFHALIQSKEKMDSEYFAKSKHLYQMVCAKITGKLKEKGLSGELDTAVFARCRTFRCPHSINSKEGKEEKPVKLLKKSTLKKASNIDLQKATGVSPLQETDYMGEKEVNSFSIDTNSVLESCAFIHHAKHNPNISEPQWQSLISVLMTIGKEKGNGKELVHEYSEGHDRYSAAETDGKIRNFELSEFSGPHGCSTIDQRWNRCNECTHYNKIKNPVQIKSDDFIATEHTGFCLVNEKGRQIPQYDDLAKWYEREYHFKNLGKSHYVFDGKKYNQKPENSVRLIAETKFLNYTTLDKDRTEFYRKVSIKNDVTYLGEKNHWFITSTRDKLNLENGVLCLKTREFLEHSHEYGFRSILPYDYDPEAKCPEFEKVLNDVTCGNETYKKILLMYMGYSVTGMIPKAAKVLFLLGEGSNGKSMFLKLWRALVGEKYARSVKFNMLKQEKYIAELDSAKVNFMEELPDFGKGNGEVWEIIKDLSSGGNMLARELYGHPFYFDNTCKLVAATNTLPAGGSKNDGTYRRMLIVRFNAVFSKENGNIDLGIVDRVIKNELSGVLNLVLKAAQELEENSFQFPENEEMQEALTEFKEKNDNAAEFCNERLVAKSPHRDDFDTDRNAEYQVYWFTADGDTVLSLDNLYNFYHEKWFPKQGTGRAVRKRDFKKSVRDWAVNTKKLSYIAERSARQSKERIGKHEVCIKRGKIFHGEHHHREEYFTGISIDDLYISGHG